MKLFLLGTCLTLFATANLSVARAHPYSSNVEVSDAFNVTSDVVKRNVAGDTNCHGSFACPIIERNLFRALKVSTDFFHLIYILLAVLCD